MAELFEKLFAEYGIQPQHREAILGYLRLIREKDQETYRHSVRVGILAAQIAAECDVSGVSQKALLWAGLLHDIGKLLWGPRLFDPTITFTEADREEMELHVHYGWLMLRGVYDFTAAVIVRSHRYGPCPYPAELPPLPKSLESEVFAIEASARVLALADYFDAMTHRNDGKFGKQLAPEEKRLRYLAENSDQQHFILQLEEKRILRFPNGSG